jgi:hypothetical protein
LKNRIGFDTLLPKSVSEPEEECRMKECEPGFPSEAEHVVQSLDLARHELTRAAQAEEYNHPTRLGAQGRYHDRLQAEADPQPHAERELWYTLQRLDTQLAAGNTKEALEAIQDGLRITSHQEREDYATEFRRCLKMILETQQP